MPGLEDLAVTLSDTFDTRVRLELGRTKGRIVVEFATQEDLTPDHDDHGAAGDRPERYQ